MVVSNSEYIMIAQDKVGCLTADGNRRRRFTYRVAQKM